MPVRFIAHGKKTQLIASQFGWRPGARYTNMRDIHGFNFEGRGFLDICWKAYDFARHLETVRATKPHITVARDVEELSQLDQVLKEAEQLQQYAYYVVIVPKTPKLSDCLEHEIPPRYLLGYSCPTRYGGTMIPPQKFTRPVHILGGRPDVQRRLANLMPVYSFDCNRFTIDASYGDYFDGYKFRPLKYLDYEKCLRLSFMGINELWSDYRRRLP
jgi:hypothetical protein